jgi:hypothetical protein
MSRWNPAVIIYDENGNPAVFRDGYDLPSWGNRAGVMQAGSDYGTPSKAQLAKIDSAGHIHTSAGIVVSTNNSTIIPLGASTTYTGTAEDITSYAEITVNLAGAPSNADGTLYFEFSPNGINWDVSVPTILTGPNIIPLPLRVVLPYFRIRYINGTTIQTSLRLTTVYHYGGAKHLTRFLNQIIDDGEPIEMTRSILVGKKPDLTYGNVPVNKNNYLKVSFADVDPDAEDKLIGADKSIFGHGITLPQISIVSADFSNPIANNDISSDVTSTGTVTQASGALTVSSGTGITSSAKAFSNQNIKYSAGREIYSKFTAAFTTPTNINSNQRVGIYSSSGSPQNGFFIGYQGTTFGITVRNNGADTFTAGSLFSTDVLDGNYNSRFTRNGITEALDPVKLNVYRIRFGWLGAAPILFQILSPDGNWVTFHKIGFPNSSTTPSITSPNLPITMEVTKSSSDATNLQIKSSSWDGGTVEDAFPFGPEDLKSHKYVTANVAAQTVDSTIYTVSTGRILKINNIIVLVVNSSVSTSGRLDIKDGGSGGSVKIPLTTTTSAVGAGAQIYMSINFPTPLRFSTNVFADIISGTLAYSITITGYEVSA